MKYYMYHGQSGLKNIAEKQQKIPKHANTHVSINTQPMIFFYSEGWLFRKADE